MNLVLRLSQSSLLTVLHGREHPANEVWVTGTFDDWGRTVKLDKRGAIHEKLVELRASEKIYYKVWSPISIAASMHQIPRCLLPHVFVSGRSVASYQGNSR